VRCFKTVSDFKRPIIARCAKRAVAIRWIASARRFRNGGVTTFCGPELKVIDVSLPSDDLGQLFTR
jgi:hypothetical protein